jgi:hypothetical protein
LAAEVIELLVHGPGQSDVEPSTHSRRAREARPPRLQGHVAKYMPKPAGRLGTPPSVTWATFVRTDLSGTLAIDFLTVPTVTFSTFYVFFVLSRRGDASST